MPRHPALTFRSLCAAFAFLAALGAGTVRAEGIAGDFDFYVLSLSWSPTYCETADDPDPTQCDRAPPGFVVHGLWPQYESGYPDYCLADEPARLNASEMGLALSLFPSPGLAQYQWRKHGICSGLNARDYLGLLGEAVDLIAVPEALAAPTRDQRVAPDEIEAAFVDVNGGLSETDMSIQCRRGDFTEIRICMTTDLQFRACPEVDSDTCRSRTITIPASQQSENENARCGRSRSGHFGGAGDASRSGRSC